jgi:hypothetical protein
MQISFEKLQSTIKKGIVNRFITATMQHRSSVGYENSPRKVSDFSLCGGTGTNIPSTPPLSLSRRSYKGGAEQIEFQSHETTP